MHPALPPPTSLTNWSLSPQSHPATSPTVVAPDHSSPSAPTLHHSPSSTPKLTTHAMPVKRVHFDIPPTPSPTLSEASLASSAGPSTPPQLTHAFPPSLAFSPKHYSPQPQLYSPEQLYAASLQGSPLAFGALPCPVRIHPMLASPSPALLWDLLHPPSTACATSTYSPLPPTLLAEPATQPALLSLTLICEMLPWSLIVTSSQGAVTLGEVLHQLYRALRLGVSQKELAYLPPEGQTRVHAAFYARLAAVAAKAGADAEKVRKEERAKGVKRVDFLVDARRFAGLSMVMGRAALNGKALGEVWAIHLALL